MLKREISEKLKLWRTQKNKKALCIIGARQIGKTTIIREFAKQEYENFIEINFICKSALVFCDSFRLSETDIFLPA